MNAVDNMQTRPGSVFQVWKWHERQELDASGNKPVIKEKEEVEGKEKRKRM